MKKQKMLDPRSFLGKLRHPLRPKTVLLPNGVAVLMYPLKKNRAVHEQYVKSLKITKKKGTHVILDPLEGVPKCWRVAEVNLGTDALYFIYYHQLQDDMIQHLKKGEIDRAFDCAEDLMIHGVLFQHYSKPFYLAKKAVIQNCKLGVLVLIDEEEPFDLKGAW